MGKPYKSELEKLGQTYAWALREPIDAIDQLVRDSVDCRLVAIGSGGSLTSAKYACLLHQLLGSASTLETPLGYRTTPRVIEGNEVVFFFTAGGSNPDVKSAFSEAIIREPKQVAAFCMRNGSPISKIAAKYEFPSVLEYQPPAGKDGFLATNSLLATCALLSRAYNLQNESSLRLPESIEKLCPKLGAASSLDPQAVKRNDWVVLHGRWSSPVAVDIESKLSESAIASAQISDYRNFAHGRHHWLASRNNDSLVVALITPEDKALAERTLSKLPKTIPVVRIATRIRNQNATLDLLLQAFALVGLAGEVRRVDPGRPKVASFGRKLYHMSVEVKAAFDAKSKLSSRAQSAILRKTNWHALPNNIKGAWIDSYNQFVTRINREKYGAVIFDYDETLCRASERQTQPSKAVAKELTRLLRLGIVIGVATGRGKSVRESLKTIIPKKYFNQVLLGYYNGGKLGWLSDASTPSTTDDIDKHLQLLLKEARSHRTLRSLAKIDVRPTQITFIPKDRMLSAELNRIVTALACRLEYDELKLGSSGRTVDVVPACVSKVDLVGALQAECNSRSAAESVLCIGDRGLWPGNDSELLSTTFSLSVYQVSSDPLTCWNLGRPGRRGVETTLEYLSYIDSAASKRNHFRIKVPK